MQIFIINFIVGLLIGMTGVGGFILPLFYISVLKMEVKDSFALSFSAFLVSGVIGSLTYVRMKLLEYKLAIKVAVGAFIGGIIGVLISSFIPDNTIKIFLYIIVFFAGVSTLINQNSKKESPLLQDNLFIITFSISVGIICSLAGAGGALIMVPVLIFLGYDVKKSVGIGIMSSVFVSLPAAIGYFIQSSDITLDVITIMHLAVHGLAVVIGARLSKIVNGRWLKLFIGFIAILSAIFLVMKEVL